MSRDRIPFFQFYPADFMNGVRGLSPQEVGVYTMLLCRIYEEDGPVEYHVRRLATYCNMREATFQKVVETLVDLGKITLSEGRLSNPRAEAEISKRAHGLEIASRAGKASAEKRKQNQRESATGVQRPFNHTDTDTDTDKEVPPKSPKGDDAKKVLRTLLSEETVDAFLELRRAKRSKVTKRAAELIVAKLKGHPNPERVILLSVENGWTGIFPDKVTQPKPSAPTDERMLRWQKLAGGVQ